MLLLNVVSTAEGARELAIYMDLESLRGIPYPDVLIRLVSELANRLRSHLRSETGLFSASRVRYGLWRLERQLNRLLDAPQESQMTVKSANDAGRGVDVEASLKAQAEIVSGRLAGGIRRKKQTTVESASSFTRTKMEGLQATVPEYRKMLKRAIETISA